MKLDKCPGLDGFNLGFFFSRNFEEFVEKKFLLNDVSGFQHLPFYLS